MPSNHPIPTLASIALSLFTSTRRVEPLPTVRVVEPWERACFAVTLDNGISEGF